MLFNNQYGLTFVFLASGFKTHYFLHNNVQIKAFMVSQMTLLKMETTEMMFTMQPNVVVITHRLGQILLEALF